MNASPVASAGPPSRPTRRSQVLTVAVVGALSALVSGFYIWAIHHAAQADATLTIPPAWAYAAWVAGTVISVVLLWWHQRHPVLVFAGVFALHLTGAVLIGNGGLGGVSLPLWFSVYALAAFARPMTAGVLVVGAWGVATTVQLVIAATSGLSLTAPEIVVVAVGQGSFFLACYMIGIGMRAERRRARDAAERAQLVQARTRAEAARAVSQERNRMARELHDLAAHQIMDVLLTTRAARLTDPNPILDEVELKTAEALGSIRAVVGALRDDDTDTHPSEPEPLADTATRAIERVSRERGLHVERRIAITREPDRAATATVVSVLTEALVNAATHAPGAPVTVALNGDRTTVRLEVRNPMRLGAGSAPRTADSGYGLVGAAERAHILSGQLETGVAQDGDWTVALTLPAVQAEVPQ